MRSTIKKTYECPETMVIKTTSQPLMINIGSGETTPEDSDANTSFFEDDEDYGSHSVNMWDDEY